MAWFSVCYAGTASAGAGAGVVVAEEAPDGAPGEDCVVEQSDAGTESADLHAGSMLLESGVRQPLRPPLRCLVTSHT